MSQHLQILENEKLIKNVEEIGKTSEELWSELNIRYSSTKLVQEVGEITSVIQNEFEVILAVSEVMSKRLDYDRGAILLVNNNSKTLLIAGSYGFLKNDIELMNSAHFQVDNFENEGIFQRVFKSQEPVLIEDMDKSDLSLNLNDLEIIVHEGESLGVIAVDNLKSQREFREGDINLLMAVASQTALSIVNARSFQKLQESEKKHRTLVETIRDIVYTIDLEGRFTYVSPMVEMITGYSDKELLGRKFLEIVRSPYDEMVMQRFADGLKSGDTSTYEIEILTKDKKAVPVELNVAPLTDNKGNSIGRIGVARDITSRYQEEVKRQEMEMRALTQDKLASLGEIATGIAHEINQPLSYIKIILESTLSDIETERLDNSELSEDFNESLRQVGKISNIISHLRTFGRSDVISFSPVKLFNVLKDTLILMNERLRIKNIKFDMKISENLPMLSGNHIKLEQVFINLIQNSMDAIEEKGKGEIALSAEVNNDDILISYSDTGVGIEPELQEKIFDPFFTTKEAGKGTGIGLSIVYGIIQEHNGTISCKSEEGKGATFKITLPIYLEEGIDSPTVPLNA
jgi:PAS domain S-box-containing protein